MSKRLPLQMREKCYVSELTAHSPSFPGQTLLAREAGLQTDKIGSETLSTDSGEGPVQALGPQFQQWERLKEEWQTRVERRGSSIFPVGGRVRLEDSD